MFIGVITAGVDQVVTLDSHVATVVDTILLIARAVMAVLYSRVIHSLRNDETVQPIQPDKLEAMRTDMLNQATATLSRQFEERITKQTETLTQMVETALTERPPVEREPAPMVRSAKVRSITEAASRQRAASDSQSTDKVVWLLLDAGKSVRAIASQTTLSAERVGRSRKRWLGANSVSYRFAICAATVTGFLHALSRNARCPSDRESVSLTADTEEQRIGLLRGNDPCKTSAK